MTLSERSCRRLRNMDSQPARATHNAILRLPFNSFTRGHQLQLLLGAQLGARGQLLHRARLMRMVLAGVVTIAPTRMDLRRAYSILQIALSYRNRVHFPKPNTGLYIMGTLKLRFGLATTYLARERPPSLLRNPNHACLTLDPFPCQVLARWDFRSAFQACDRSPLHCRRLLADNKARA